MAKEYRASILSVYDEDRQKIAIPAIKGESAYEYAINNGYVGSKEDYAKDCNPDNIKKDVEDFVLEELAKRGQLKPEFANSKEELDLSGDPTKLYVLPDGYIWAHMKTVKPAYDNLVETSTEEPGGTAIYNGSGYSDEYRWSSSKKAPDKQTHGRLTGWIDYKQGATLRLKNFGLTYNEYVPGGYIVFCYSDGSTGTITIGVQTTDEYSTVLNTSGVTHFRISSYGKGQSSSIGTPIITLNQEIVEGTVEAFEWTQTPHRFVPAEYEDRIVNLETLSLEQEADIQYLQARTESSPLLMYISPTGSDDNDGLTAATPKKTVAACVKNGATQISAKRGIYAENIYYANTIKELEIFPTDNDLTHEKDLERSKIIFDSSDTILPTSLSDYNSIKKVAYSNSSNTQFDKVFVKQSQPPIYGDGNGSRYNATVWLFSEDERTVCIKLKPVLTITECEAESNTFAYVEGYIYINADMTSVSKISIPTNWDNAFHIEGANRLVLKEVEVRFGGGYNINVKNCAYFEFYKCACKYTTYGSGFHPLNSNGIMTSCYATKNYDGYGISGYGHTTYIDCVSEFNFDDGMSHHSGTSGTVIGGRYEGNGKGGCVPAYGAEVNIYGGIYKDNKSFGIGYLWYSESNPAHGTVEGAIMVGNAVGLSVQSNCDVTTSNCVYKDNTTDKDIKGNLVEYNSVYNTNNNNNNNNNNNTKPQYDNLLFETKNADGSDYYGDNGLKGYRLNYRYSASKKGEVEAPGYQVLGYIPVDGGDIIRIKNVLQADLNTDSFGYATAYFFNGDFSQLGGPIYFSGTEFTNKMYTFTVPSYNGIAWCKLTLIGVTNSTIVTKNQEIIENNNGNNGNNGNNSSTPYVNRLPSAIMGSDQATGWLDGKGYTQNARLSGSAGTAYTGYTTIAGMCVSGYITDLKIGDVIRIKGFYPPQGVSTYVISYNGTTQVSYNQIAPAHADTGWGTGDWYTVKNPTKLFEATMTFTLTSEYFGDSFDSIRFSGVFGDNVIVTVNEEIDLQESEETYEEAILRIKNWKYPIFEDAPVFLLESDKPAISAAEESNDAVYAKYDALMAKYPWYITRQNCGMASDGNTPIYVYHFKEPTPHYSSGNWSETKPVILVCSGVHPTERTGIYSMYYAMEEITENLKLLDLRRNIHFVIMPIINPTAVNDSEWGVRNPEGIQVHYNFEVDFKYPTDAGYVDLGNRNHGGTTPLSIPETQYFDSLMQEYKDNLACVLSCHNYDVDGTRGTDYIWCSCATHFMCNVAYRLIDKMSAAWRAKHGSYFDEGLVWANNYALQAKESGSPSLFGSAIARDSWDYRVGMASLSGSGGTEYKQALKYGVHGINIESCDRWLVMDRDYSKKRTTNVVTAGAETYINFFRTYMAAYDLKNKKDYAPNLPME